jgi:hypothetical protein
MDKLGLGMNPLAPAVDEIVEDADAVAPLDEPGDEMAADKAGTASYEDERHSRLTFRFKRSLGWV